MVIFKFESMFKLLISLALLTFVTIQVECQCGCRPGKLKRGINFLVDDMKLDQQDIMKINGYKGYDPNAKKWTGNTLKYSFHPQFPNDKKSIVRQSMNELTNSLGGCVKYVESNAGHHILVQAHKPGCNSFVGMYETGTGYQELNLEAPGCLYSKGTIKHEFIHATGFLHTQMRNDRDNHVNIYWNRIDSRYCSAFTRCLSCVETVQYKTNSVMHYPSESFPCPGQTITVVDKNGKSIPYNHDIIAEDVKMIKDMYCK